MILAVTDPHASVPARHGDQQRSAVPKSGESDADYHVRGAGGTGGVEVPEDLSDDSARLCGYRDCRAALPAIAGPGNRAKYCQDDKRWGTKALTCKQAAAALENVVSLGGPAALEDPSVLALGEHVDRALSPLTQLTQLLTAVRTELDTAVTAARRERDAALASAADADGRADLAAARTAAASAPAEAAAAAAAQMRAQADTERNRAQDAQQRAERAQAIAEARLADAQDTVARADRRATAAVDRADQLEQQLSSLRAELLATQQALEEERQRCNAETDRANQAITAAATERDRLRHQLDVRADQLRAEYQQSMEQTRASYADELIAQRVAADQTAAQTMNSTRERQRRSIGSSVA